MAAERQRAADHAYEAAEAAERTSSANLVRQRDLEGRGLASTRARELAEGFAVWLHDQGQGAWRPNSVARRLKEKSGRWASPATGQRFTQRKSSSMHYDGVRFTDVFKRRMSEVPRDSRGNLLFGVQSDAQG